VRFFLLCQTDVYFIEEMLLVVIAIFQLYFSHNPLTVYSLLFPAWDTNPLFILDNDAAFFFQTLSTRSLPTPIFFIEQSKASATFAKARPSSIIPHQLVAMSAFKHVHKTHVDSITIRNTMTMPQSKRCLYLYKR